MRKRYQRKQRKSNPKFQIVRGQELLVQVPLPIAEVWSEFSATAKIISKYAGNCVLLLFFLCYC